MKQEILSLQQEMAARGITACLIPTSDFHQSEYVNPFFKTRQYLTGFTGSAGTLLVTQTEADLWTDGRYFLQAERQLAGTGITLQRMGEPGVDTIPEYLKKHLPEGCRLAVDGRTISASYGQLLERILQEKHGELCADLDPAGLVWSDRPTLTGAVPFILPETYAGVPASRKLTALREEMVKKNAQVHLLTTLDDIAWLLNLRGSDVAYNPVFYSFFVISAEEAQLYAFPEAISPEIRGYLEELSIEVCPYETFYASVGESCRERRVLVDLKKINYLLYRTLAQDTSADRLIPATNPTTLQKAIKNETEIACLRRCHKKDGVAMVNFIHWLKTQVGHLPITEISASDYLEQCRRAQKDFLDLSFDTISGYGPHGAIVHYSATPETDSPLKPEGLLLVDSGGQYLDGTTDITRTIALGPVTQQMKEDFTLVLRSMLSLARARFPRGCTGANLDPLARMPFWEKGLDYNHGTGHGVGFLLNVHEGPNGFHWKTSGGRTTCVQEPGMVTTDEPGLYVAGSHGIRTENELLCVEGPKTEYGEFLEFEILTLCPIDREAILPEQLTAVEREALNQYHEKVYETLQDALEPDVREWLWEVTRPL